MGDPSDTECLSGKTVINPPDADPQQGGAADPSQKAAATLEGSAAFKSLTDDQKAVLRDWVKSGITDSDIKAANTNPRADDPDKRADDANDMAVVMQGAPPLAQTCADIIKELPATIMPLCRLRGADWFNSPKFEGAVQTGDGKTLAQQRLARVIGLLANNALRTAPAAKKVLDNTIERFVGDNIPLILVSLLAGGNAVAMFDDKARNITLALRPISIEPSGINDKTELVRKMAHEVNHSCRAGETSAAPNQVFHDEFYAYVTESIAGTGRVSRKNVFWITGKECLKGPVYNLGSFIDGADGKAFLAALRYSGTQDDDSFQFLDVTSIPKPSWSTSAGWNLENRTS